MPPHHRHGWSFAVMFFCMACTLAGCSSASATPDEVSAPLFANYTRTRNPPALAQACGVEKISSRAEERAFITALRTLDGGKLKPLLLVIGGFTDGMSGYAYEITQAVPEQIKNTCDIFYREHDEDGYVRELLRIYAAAGKRIIVVGHSWGGSCAVIDALPQEQAPVDLLVTLDPVGRKRPEAPLAHVKKWINIYVEYEKAPWLDISNAAARTGSPWQSVPFATVNIASAFSIHDNALAMFQRYAQEDVLALLPK